MLLVVALATQVVWVLARYAGEEMFGRSGYLAGLEFGIWLASTLVAALAMFDLATRLSSPRKVGAVIAAAAFTACAGCVIGVYVASRAPDDWVGWMYAYGWRGLEMIVIAGLAIAGGQRAMWVAAPAIGLAVVGHPSATLEHDAQLWYAGIGGLRVVLVFVLMQDAERFATHETSYRRLARGLRIFEIGLSMSAGLMMCRLLPVIELPTSPVIAFITNVSFIAFNLVSASGAWLIVRSRMAEVPRWPFALVLVTLLWQTARTARSWTITLSTKWDHFETVKLKYLPWWVYIPSTIGTLCVAGALVVLARRLQVSTRVSLVPMMIIVSSFALSAIQIAPNWITIVLSAVANVVLMLAMRTARANVHLVHERAMHAHTFT